MAIVKTDMGYFDVDFHNDEFNFNIWVSENNLSQPVADALMKEQYMSEEKLQNLNEGLVEKIAEKYKLSMAEGFGLIQGINKLKEADDHSFKFAKWATENGLKKEAIDALKSEDFDSYELLYTMEESYIEMIGKKFGFSLGMKMSILNAVNKLKSQAPVVKKENGHIEHSCHEEVEERSAIDNVLQKVR